MLGRTWDDIIPIVSFRTKKKRLGICRFGRLVWQQFDKTRHWMQRMHRYCFTHTHVCCIICIYIYTVYDIYKCKYIDIPIYICIFAYICICVYCIRSVYMYIYMGRYGGMEGWLYGSRYIDRSRYDSATKCSRYRCTSTDGWDMIEPQKEENKEHMESRKEGKKEDRTKERKKELR